MLSREGDIDAYKCDQGSGFGGERSSYFVWHFDCWGGGGIKAATYYFVDVLK